LFFFFQAEDGIRGPLVTGVQTCALPISARAGELSAWTRGVIDAVRGSGRALDTRRAMSRETARRLAQIRALKPSILARARRHAQIGRASCRGRVWVSGADAHVDI